MLGYRWSICLTVIAVMCQESLTASIRTKRQLEQELSEQSDDINPIDAEETFADSLDRQKRKLPDGAFGAKNAIIGFVFSGSKSSALGSAKTVAQGSGLSSAQGSVHASGQASAQASAQASRLGQSVTQSPIKTTTDDTPDFDRKMVSLVVPDMLFSSSFTTVTNVSKLFGDLIMNSARRYAQFVRFFKPVLGKTLIVKGYEPTTTTTTTAPDSNNV